jgi:hypothetical protein
MYNNNKNNNDSSSSSNNNNKTPEDGFVKNDAFVNIATQTLPTFETEIAPCFRILIV